MKQTATASSQHYVGYPMCKLCGSPTRLIGIEPHPRDANIDLRTFACTDCDALQTQSVPFSSL